MPYTEYNTEQREIINQFGLLYQGPRNKVSDNSHKFKNKSKLPKPIVMPSKLIRVSDMVVVPGNEVDEGYCALSYSWDHCGEPEWNKTTAEIKRIDKGKHTIYTKIFEPELQKNAISLRFVNFKTIIQQICKDFGINYIFYDQECITVDNKKERQYEISQMNKVFKNASFTVVLIPELCYSPSESGVTCVKMANIDVISSSSWGKCMWTLEEAFISKRILFVGKDVYMWSDVISNGDAIRTRANPFLYTLCNKKEWCVSTFLFHSHIRQPTRDRYRVDVLSYIFPKVREKLGLMTYNEPPLKWMPQFYGCLAENDISILCFGAYLYYQDIAQPHHNQDPSEDHLSSTSSGINTNFEAGVPITKYDLPSWTGVFGEHVPAIGFKKLFQDCRIEKRYMHLTSTSIPISIKNTPGSFKIKQQERCCPGHSGFIYPLSPTWLQGVIRLLYIDSSKKSITFTATETEETTSTHHASIGEYHQIKATHILPVERADKYWTTSGLQSSSPQVIGGYLSLTENCTDCEILEDIQFEIYRDSIAMPVVVKKDKKHYKAIGICVLASPYRLSDSSIIQRKKTFAIL
ncbi:hypothetical protein INT45_009060 [Circinella minor]|uniref:Heterokaryon incompatibility domain-containing protein n=1 Tax=Circinella minor TaxID=1195481 RepID=A0A8H7S9U7_9FUNG|nr:hypothetical protein INT45_009060 [Circinella minor]